MDKKIYINYNTIANWQSRLIHEFEKAFPDIEYDTEKDLENVDPKELWKYFDFPVFVTLETDFDVDGVKNEDDVKSVQVEATDRVDANPDYFRQFLNDNIIEVFGNCNERQRKIVENINKLIAKGYDVTITSNFSGKIRGAIYFFLSRNVFQGNALFGEELPEGITMEELNKLIEGLDNNG